MADEWYGHRHTVTGEPNGDRDEWIEWDHLLISAYQTVEAYTDQNGLYRWETEDEATYVDAVRKIDKFEEAKQLVTGGQNYHPTPGEYFVPDIKTRRKDGQFPSFAEYMEKQKNPPEEAEE